MARIWQAGAELQSVANAVEFTAFTTNAPAIETTTKRSGAAAWRINNTGGSEGFRHVHTTTQASFFFRFYLYIVTMPTGTKMIGGFSAVGTYKAGVRLTPGGLLQLYNQEDSAQIGSDSSALSTGTWYRIEIKCDSTTLSSTAVEANAYEDEAGASSFWNPSGTINITTNPNCVRCGTDGADATLDYIVDDLAVNDTSGSIQNSWPGPGKIIHLYPNGNGDNSGWTGSDGNQTDNYLLVDEFPPVDTDYVQSNTSGQIDDYALTNAPAEMESGATINVVAVGVRAAVENATGADPDIVLRIKAAASGTTDETGNLDVNSVTFNSPIPTPQSPPDTYRLVLYDLPGASTTAWTKADLDTAQVGVRESVSDTHFARVSSIWVSVDFNNPSGTQYTQDASGGITPSGAIAKEGRKPLTGANTPAGTVAKETSKAFSGGITPAGSLLKQAQKILSGAITSITGAVTTALIYAKILAGSITPSGDLTKQGQKPLSGSITSSGSISKQGDKILGATITPTGAISKLTNKLLSGAITSIVGTLESVRTVLKILEGTLTSSGSLSKQGQKSFSGNISPSGVLTKTTEKLLSGAITVITGTLDRAKQAVKALEGTLTSSGSLTKQGNKAFTGNITPVGTIIKTTLKNLLGAITSAGDLITEFIGGGGDTFFQSISGGITPVGTLMKSTAKTFVGSLTTDGSLLKSASKFFTGTLTQSGSISKSTSKAFTGDVTPSGSLGITRAFLKALDGAVTFAGTISKQINKQLSGNIIPQGVISKLVSLFLSGVLIPVGAANKLMQQVLSGVLSFSGTLTTLVGDFDAIISKVYLEGRYALRATLEGLASRTTRLSGVHKAIVSLLGTLEDD